MQGREIACRLVEYSDSSLKYVVILQSGKLAKVSSAESIEQVSSEAPHSIPPLKTFNPNTSRGSSSSSPNSREKQVKREFYTIVPDPSSI